MIEKIACFTDSFYNQIKKRKEMSCFAVLNLGNEAYIASDSCNTRKHMFLYDTIDRNLDAKKIYQAKNCLIGNFNATTFNNGNKFAEFSELLDRNKFYNKKELDIFAKELQSKLLNSTGVISLYAEDEEIKCCVSHIYNNRVVTVEYTKIPELFFAGTYYFEHKIETLDNPVTLLYELIELNKKCDRHVNNPPVIDGVVSVWKITKDGITEQVLSK